MSEKEFETLLEDYLPEEKKSGDVVEGIITRKELDYGFLDLNAKKEGRIYASEVKDFEIGDKIEVKVLREDEDNIIVSKFVLDRAKELASFNVDDIVTGEIVKKIKGGYTVRIGKNEAFLPFSLARFEKDKDYTGQKFKFIIKEKNRSNITISRIDLIKIEEEKYFESVNVGDVVTGKVKEIFDFGIILDLGAASGFVHISEISWDQVDNLHERYKIGDEVTAKIIEKDVEKNRLKLSIKQLSEDPWVAFENSHNVGDVVEAVVKDVLDFGIVVTVDGNSGFVHVSELAWHNGSKELKNYKAGDKFSAKIIQIENEKLINYLLSLNMNRESRILKSNEFGEFVSPVSFQHGLSGYLFYLSHMRDIYDNGRIIEWLISEGNQNKGNVYLNGCSILFGSSGYLWVLLEFYKKITSNNPSRELIIDKIRDIYKDLMSSYQKVEVFDFALGKSGILLSLMKYCINFNDVDSMKFIREKIEELYSYFVDEIRNVNSLKECNFAHGLAGIAYVISIYNSEFEFKAAYENSIKVFKNNFKVSTTCF